MSILKLMEAQESAFTALRDILDKPNEYDVETQNLRANLALAVANMVPAGTFDFQQDQAQVPYEAEVLIPNFGDVSDPDQQAEITAEEQAALAQVTTLPHTPMNPHGAPPLGGVG